MARAQNAPLAPASLAATHTLPDHATAHSIAILAERCQKVTAEAAGHVRSAAVVGDQVEAYSGTGCASRPTYTGRHCRSDCDRIGQHRYRCARDWAAMCLRDRWFYEKFCPLLSDALAGQDFAVVEPTESFAIYVIPKREYVPKLR